MESRDQYLNAVWLGRLQAVRNVSSWKRRLPQSLPSSTGSRTVTRLSGVTFEELHEAVFLQIRFSCFVKLSEVWYLSRKVPLGNCQDFLKSLNFLLSVDDFLVFRSYVNFDMFKQSCKFYFVDCHIYFY